MAASDWVERALRWVRSKAAASSPGCTEGGTTTATSIPVRLAPTIRRAAGAEDGIHSVRHSSEAALLARAEPALVKALEHAFRYQGMLDEGRRPETRRG
jgi:hypothetical protein